MVLSELKKEKVARQIMKESDLNLNELIQIKIESCRLSEQKDIYEKNKKDAWMT